MNRRDFLLLAQAIGLSAWFGDMAFAQTAMTRTRKSISTSSAAEDLETLRNGVALLKKNASATQLKSWMYWANSHGTPDPIPTSMERIWGQCHHGTPHFLSWHRAYVFFFESLIREITQQDNFALPYWDWYSSNSIPNAYADQNLSETQNHLFHEPRDYRARTLLRDALRQPTFSAFQSSLEGNPHGTVHVMVGGEMGFVDTSARDPIFWAHHTNIDRMWEVWIAADPSRQNPTNNNWLGQSFAFDSEGKKALLVKDMLKTESLGYRYDSLAAAAPSDAVPARPANTVVVQGAVGIGTLGISPQSITVSKPISLTGQSINIKLMVPATSKGKLSVMAAPAGQNPATLTVRLDGVRATDEGLKRGFEYRLYANLPRTSESSSNHQSHYLGVLNSFQMGHHAKHGMSISFPISPLAEAQGKDSSWSSSAVNFSLVSDDEATKTPLVTIEKVQLILSSSPLM